MSAFACDTCGYEAAKWFGRCPDCGAWSSAVTPQEGSEGTLEVVTLGAAGPTPDRIATGIAELDRVLGGGIVAASVTLMAGEPGIGKSTLALQALTCIAGSGRSCLLVTGEESLAQVATRATRLQLDASSLKVASSTSLQSVIRTLERDEVEVVVIDSIQTLQDSATPSSPGSPAQVRIVASHLVEVAKRTGVAIVLIGHVTKDGAVAGPKTLEHVVDAVITLEGERSGTLRLLRAAKNRFGPCDETGVFTMTGLGLEPVLDPSAMFLEDRHPDVAGSVVFPTLDGTRTLLVEVQALTVASELPQPRRVAIGLDARRVALVGGVLQQSKKKSAAGRDLFVAVAGGMEVKEPAVDLAVALSCWSSASDRSIDPGLVVLGEIGLGGEIRRVQGVGRRLAEAARMGFTRALVPRGNHEQRNDIEVIPLAHLSDALDLSFLRSSLHVARG